LTLKKPSCQQRLKEIGFIVLKMKIYFTFEMWFSKESFCFKNGQLLLAANRYRQPKKNTPTTA
jgi:hypothetical protein